jgi:hypothetical protein
MHLNIFLNFPSHVCSSQLIYLKKSRSSFGSQGRLAILGPVCVGFVLNTVALGQVFLRVLSCCPVSIITQVLCSFVHVLPTIYNLDNFTCL